jgi:hypothetical protein
VARRNMACAPRNRWISTSHYFKLDVHNSGISKIHLKTHEKKNYFPKYNRGHELKQQFKMTGIRK